MIRRYNISRSDNYPVSGSITHFCNDSGTIKITTGFPVKSAIVSFATIPCTGGTAYFTSSSSSESSSSSSGPVFFLSGIVYAYGYEYLLAWNGGYVEDGLYNGFMSYKHVSEEVYVYVTGSLGNYSSRISPVKGDLGAFYYKDSTDGDVFVTYDHVPAVGNPGYPTFTNTLESSSSSSVDSSSSSSGNSSSSESSIEYSSTSSEEFTCPSVYVYSYETDGFYIGYRGIPRDVGYVQINYICS